MYLDLIQNKGPIVQTIQRHLATEHREAVAQRRSVREHLLPVLKTLGALPSWGDVRAVSGYVMSLTLYLRGDAKASHLPREIAQAFHAMGRKSAADDTLSVDYDLPGGVSLTVNGYLPATCRIERVQEYIPAHTGWVSKVVCTGGEVADTEVPV